MMKRKVGLSCGLLFLGMACAAKLPPVPEAAPQSPKTAALTVSPPEASVPSPKADSPIAVIQEYTEHLRSIADPAKRTVKGEVNSKQERKIAEAVREFFDFRGLARMSLGTHWRKISAAQQKEFSDLFIELLEKSYLRRSRNIIGNYEIKYGAETITGQRAKATCTVIRRDANVDITYELHRVGKTWMIFNIILDDVDLVRNYQTQFNHIIKSTSFDGLLSKLRKKQGEMDTEVTL